MPLAIVLGVAAVMWPVALGAALVDRLDHQTSLAAGVVYLAAGQVCHQRSDRSFHTHGYQWPVCSRCAGLYGAAPIGVAIAALMRRRRRATLLWLVTAAAMPTAVVWGAEVLGVLPSTGAIRAATAAPLGSALAFVLVMLVRPSGVNRIN